MTLKVTTTAVVDNGGGNTYYALSSLIAVTATSNPAYLIVDALDRNEYTVNATGATGYLSGNGAALGLYAQGGDARGAGIVFAWQASSSQYVNATYGTLSQLTYTESASPNDITNLSFWGTSNAIVAQACAANAYSLMQADAAGYLGSTTFATEPAYAGTAPAQATPDSVIAAAQAMVGQDWNNAGCWVLASTIAAEAGAGLPVQSTALNTAGVANGEWVPVYNGPAAASSNWESLVSAGDMVVFSSSASSGHITTCVSGTGASAMVVDNITYIGQAGRITDSANDGSPSDIVIQAAHPAVQEFANVVARNVVIYALDAPAISDLSASETLATGASITLATLFSATDPAHKAITSYQVYDTGGSDSLMVGGQTQTGDSESVPIGVSSLASISLAAGIAPTTDTLDIRAFNGTYWGDWQSLGITVATPPPKPAVLSARTPPQTWLQGAAVGLVLPATLFKDPQASAIRLSAGGVAGAGLPAWLSFNPATRAFTGTVPAGMEKFSVVVTATDALGTSASETFAVTVPAAAPVLATQEGPVSLAESSAGNFALPQNGFVDPQGESLTLKASLANGSALPGWLKFTAGTGIFSGVAPASAQTLQLKVMATDTSGLSASDMFSVAVVPGSNSALSIGDWTATALAPKAGVGGIGAAGGTAALNEAIPAIFSHPIMLGGHAA